MELASSGQWLLTISQPFWLIGAAWERGGSISLLHGLLSIFGEVESAGTSAREMEVLLSGMTRFFLLSSGQENCARPPNHPISPNVILLAKSFLRELAL
jgi:hypothetical protein